MQFTSTTTVGNALVYLNNFGDMTLDNNITPTLMDIASYLSSFDVIVTIPKPLGSPELALELELIEIVNSYNSETRFYLYIDGRNIVTPASAGNLTPTQQINDTIVNLIATYTSPSGSVLLIDGIYVDYFNFPNVQFNALYHDTYRDVQIEAQSVTSLNNLYFAFSCQPEAGKSTWVKATNLPQVLNAVPAGYPANKPLYLNLRNMLIVKDLIGGDFDFPTSSSSVGWASRSDFFFNVLTINSILTNPYNINAQVMMITTAHNTYDYGNPQFFFAAQGGTNPQPAGGVAQESLALCYWLNYQYLATAAYDDLYLNQVYPNLVHYTFNYDNVTAASDYNQRGQLIMYNQSILQYALAPQNSYIEVNGTNTSVLQITNNNRYNNIIVP